MDEHKKTQQPEHARCEITLALSERDKEQIYLEYEQMLYTRKKDENRRLEQVRLEQAEGKTKK